MTALLSFTYPVLAIPNIHRKARFVERDDQSSSDTQFDRAMLPYLGRAQVCPCFEFCLILAQVYVLVSFAEFADPAPLA
jgi:hypothetical protein